MVNESRKPEYYKPPKKNDLRRALWHDYKSPSIYMITLRKSSACPSFATIDNPSAPTLTPIGRIIQSTISTIHDHHKELRILHQVVMPDHLHFLLRITRRVQQPLGQYIRSIKSNLTGHIRQLCNLSKLQVFDSGFHDRILRSRNQLDTLFKYIDDNPRRFWIKKQHPHLFTRINRLKIDNTEFLAYGNIFLLRDFERQAVVIHRHWTSKEKEQNIEEWLRCAQNGGVLVSAFISQDEKSVRDKAICLGARLILLSQDAVGERYKPAGNLFDLCARGRLLILFPWADRIKNPGITRSESLQMNFMAGKIASSIFRISIIQ